jgi:ubiquinol-cytochrome c reductase iron-sulfur subunit
MTVKWRGKPVFIRHRTPAEISTAQSEDNVELRDPQTDADRCKDPRYLGISI